MNPALPPPPVSPLELFLSLVRVPSPSREEGRLAAEIQAWLESAGVSATVDDAASVTGGDTGNVVVQRRAVDDGRGSACPTVLFIAHIDTVQTHGTVVDPVVGDDGVVRSGGDTILGADNKSAVAAVLSVLTQPREEHADLVAVFSTCEESGRMGVTALGDLAEKVDYAFPVDGCYPVGTVLEAALGQIPFELVVRGRESHAAKDPEHGIHAIKAASEIVSRLELGRVGEELVNVSQIAGGSETNIVPALAVIRGEVRSYSVTGMAAALARVQAVANDVAAESGVKVELQPRPEDGAPPFPPAHSGPPAQIAAAAAAAAGLELQSERCEATLEANYLAGMGIPTLGIASGGRHPHTNKESLPVQELERLVEFLDAILRCAGDQ